MFRFFFSKLDKMWWFFFSCDGEDKRDGVQRQPSLHPVPIPMNSGQNWQWWAKPTHAFGTKKSTARQKWNVSTMTKAAEISIVAACLLPQACREKAPVKQKLEKTKKAVTGFKYIMLCWPFLFIIKTSRRVLQFYVRPWIICIHIVFCVTFITFLRFRYSSICLYRKKLLFFLFFIFVDLIYENLQVCPPSLPFPPTSTNFLMLCTIVCNSYFFLPSNWYLSYDLPWTV